MKERIDVRLSPTQKVQLRRVAEVRRRSMADTVKVLIEEEYAKVAQPVAQQGETEELADETKREA